MKSTRRATVYDKPQLSLYAAIDTVSLSET
jgi:hypothetical protein